MVDLWNYTWTFKQKGRDTMNLSGEFILKGYVGTWELIAECCKNGHTYYLAENITYSDMPYLVIDEDENIICESVDENFTTEGYLFYY